MFNGFKRWQSLGTNGLTTQKARHTLTWDNESGRVMPEDFNYLYLRPVPYHTWVFSR